MNSIYECEYFLQFKSSLIMKTKKLTFFLSKFLKFVNAQTWIVGHLGKRS